MESVRDCDVPRESDVGVSCVSSIFAQQIVPHQGKTLDMRWSRCFQGAPEQKFRARKVALSGLGTR